MRLVRAALLGAVLLAAPVAQADSVAELRSELSALSAVVADLARELSSGEAASQPDFDGSLIDRVDRIRAELARLTGRTEELEFRIRRAIDEASNRLGDLEFRLTELEGGDTSALPPPQPLGGDAAQAAETPQLAAGERAAFDDASALVDAGDHEAAAAALEQFLEFYPGSPLSAEASFMLASAHRERGAESEAARAYLNLYLADTDGPDAPRALLALGDSLARLEQREEACVMFDELLERFPDSDAASEAEEARARITCP